jgi:Family of unknown function (DUF6220)
LRRVFAVLAAVLLAAVVAQFFLAASGAFDSAATDEAFRPHRALGSGIIAVAILLTIVAAVARVPGRLIAMTGLVAALGVVQSLIRDLADAFNGPGDTSTTAGTLIFGLHAVNGLVILALVGAVARRALALSRPAAAQPQAGAG